MSSYDQLRYSFDNILKELDDICRGIDDLTDNFPVESPQPVDIPKVHIQSDKKINSVSNNIRNDEQVNANPVNDSSEQKDIFLSFDINLNEDEGLEDPNENQFFQASEFVNDLSNETRNNVFMALVVNREDATAISETDNLKFKRHRLPDDENTSLNSAIGSVQDSLFTKLFPIETNDTNNNNNNNNTIKPDNEELMNAIETNCVEINNYRVEKLDENLTFSSKFKANDTNRNEQLLLNNQVCLLEFSLV